MPLFQIERGRLSPDSIPCARLPLTVERFNGNWFPIANCTVRPCQRIPYAAWSPCCLTFTSINITDGLFDKPREAETSIERCFRQVCILRTLFSYYSELGCPRPTSDKCLSLGLGICTVRFHSVCGSPSTRGAEDARSNTFPIPYTVYRAAAYGSSSARCMRRTHPAKTLFVSLELKTSYWSLGSAGMAVRRPSKLRMFHGPQPKDRKHVF